MPATRQRHIQPADQHVTFGHTGLHRLQRVGVRYSRRQRKVSNIYTETHLAWYFYRVRFADIHGNLSEFSDELHGQWPTGVPGVLPTAMRLHPCRPNPFNPRTMIKYDLPEAGSVRLAVFDLAGRLVRMLVDESRSPGTYEAAWDGRDTEGREVGSGTYLARLEALGKVEVMRMALLR